MVNCPVCGREVDGKKFCPNCGSTVMEEEKQTDSQSKSETKYCSNCGAEIDIKAEICPKCGVRESVHAVEKTVKVEKTTKFCANCGAEIDIKAEICPKCGVRQSNINSQSSDKNVWVALVLSLLVVGLGHFYLGLPKKAIMLIVLTIVCWILIFFFIGIILYPLMLIYGVYDVYKSANAMANGEYVEDKLF